MDRPSASDTPVEDPPATTPQTGPEQGKFSVEQTDFLKTYLSTYEALCRELGEQATGIRRTGSIKGRKKEWIVSEVFPEFVKQFLSDKDGGQLLLLQTKILRWFTNRSPRLNPSSDSKASTADTSRQISKPPLATDGAKIFAEEHVSKIKERMAEQDDHDEERHAYKVTASKRNETLEGTPGASEIFKNQEEIVSGVAKALNDLIGSGWGQYGKAAFFLQGAYRNSADDLKTFNVSVSPTKIDNFASTLPDYKIILHVPFRKWAENALPVREGAVDTVAAVASVTSVGIDNVTAELDNNISETSDSFKVPSPRLAKHTADSDASPRDRGTYDDRISPQLQYSPPPLSEPAASTPVIPPQSSKYLSESIIKAAIEKIVEAGYLNIVSDSNVVYAPDQVPQHLKTTSQKDGKAETSKRRREETEETDERGGTDDKPTKRHRAKVAVPPREQSSR